MSTTAITMEELESERAELLPSRETLTNRCGCKTTYGSTSSIQRLPVRAGQRERLHNYTVGLVNVQADNNNVNILGLRRV